MSEVQQNRSWSDSVPLATVLRAGAIISATTSSGNITSNLNGLPDVLHTRLEQFDSIIDGISRTRSLDLSSLQLDTACASLFVIERVHNLLLDHDAQYTRGTVVPPLIGSKDMAQIRTHLSVVFNWGTELLLSRILPTLPDKMSRLSRVPPDAQIIDLTPIHEDYVLLFNIVTRVLRVVLPEGPQGPSSSNLVEMTVLSRGFTDVLRICIFLGWLPKDARGGIQSAPDLKPYVARLLNSSQPAQSITALGSIMRRMQKPLYVRKVCRILSTEQLLRPAGVAGLLSSVFGEDVSSTEAPLEKLQSTSNVLNTLPSGMPPEEYYPIMIPRLLQLLSPALDKVTPPSHLRAAAFALSRMLTGQVYTEYASAASIQRAVVNWCLLDSLKPVPRPKSKANVIPQATPVESPALSTDDDTSKSRSIATAIPVISPSQAVPTLSTIFMNTDPSPELIDVLLTPISGRLYTLLEYLQASKTADPMTRETVEGLLGIWARIAEKREIVDALWEIIEGRGGDWDVDDAGELHVFERSTSLPSLTLAQLADLQEGKLNSEENEEPNPLNLHPHPLHFAQFIKSMKREDVASSLYLRILDAHVKLDNDEDPLKKLLLFKLGMQIASQVGADAPADSPLRRPDATRMLMFIKMSLDQDEVLRKSKNRERGQGKLTRESLRFVPEDEADEEEGDSDDDDLAPGLEGVSKREYLSVTAVNLLLALLQEHPDLSPRTEPLLNDIYSQLEPLANSSSEALSPRAREARLTLTARLASSSPAAPRGNEVREGEEEGPQERYQRALRLLQDPLLPVRAHGLLLLRELVAPAKATPVRKGNKDKPDGAIGARGGAVQGAEIGAPSVDAALVPAILSIFMQSIQDEDSYIFLNAVQGLSAMVDGFGREVLKSLVDEYSKGLGGVGGSVETMSKREVDLRVRVGEALGQVIKRCGGALGKYVDTIVPSLFAVVRASHLPTTLRTSAVSLLATAADTNTVALSAYSADLITAMIDLVQVESVRATAASPAPKGPETPRSPHSPEVTVVDSDSPKESDGKVETRLGDAGGGTRSHRSRGKENPKPGTAEKYNAAPVPQLAGQKKEANTTEVGADGDAGIENSMDARPTVANPKFPPLRRAALHFLSLLLRSVTVRAYEGERVPGSSSIIPPGFEMNHAMTVLGYVSTTDADQVVRVMAREVTELLQQLRNALLGL